MSSAMTIIKIGCLHSFRVNRHDNMLRGSWRKWKNSSPHVPGTVSKQKSPSPQNVCCLYQRLREDGSLRPRCIGGRLRQTMTPAFEEEVLERVGNDPSSSTRAVSLERTKPSCIPPPESTRTGAQRLHTSCSFCPVVYATEHHESSISCKSLNKRWLLQQQKQPHLG